LSNFSNEKGELVNIPDTYKDNRPVIKVDNLDTDVEIVEEGIAINTRRIETDYANKAYLETSVAENNYGSRGLDTFKIKDDPFQTLASYYRYVIARESIRVNNPIELLEDNSEFMRRVYTMGNANDAYESYISERALAASFNNKYIMGKTKYSYSDSLLNLINEFGDILKVNYPITAQLAPGTNTEGAKVLQLNNQKEAQGELASTYRNNLRNLADPSVTKVQNKNKTDVENESDNQRISEMFNLFSLNMFYQHGVGKTRLGFVKALDPVQYKDIVVGGSRAFLKNYLSTEKLDEIFNTVVSMDKFKNYLVSPEGYIHSDLATTEISKPTNDGTLETFDDSEGEDEVLVRLINQEDVNAFNDYVKKSGGKRPEKFFTAKTLYPAFYNSATGKREGMPQTAIWIKNQYGTYDMLDQETGEYYYENVNLATGMQITKKEDVQPTEPTEGSTQLSEYTNHSGGALGSDTQWDVIGKEFGMVNNQHYYTGVISEKNAPLGNVDITDKPIAIEGAKKVADAAREMWGYKYNTMKDQRLIRNWAQVANSDAVFAIGTLGKEGDIWKGDEKSAEPRKLLKFAVQGGTGYAVEMAIQAGKPVYVFDQVRNQWYKNIKGQWSKSEVPTLTKNFAGIGTREINEAGKQAIRDVYKNTVSQVPTQPSTTSTSESVADIPQNKVSGINSYGSTVTANNEAIKALGPNPHSIDMIEAGFRTRTTRSESEMAKYAIKVGDTIKHFGKSADGSTKTVYAKVTAIHPKGSEGWKGTWNKEGWRAEDVNVIDRFKDGAAAIEFEVIQPSTQPVSQPTVKPTKAPVSPAPADSIENDMKVYAYLLNERGGVQPQYFKAGPNENRVYNLNKFGNYDLIDAVTGEIYMRNINMETGKQETEPFLNSPVDPEVIQKALDKLITQRATTNIEEQLAVKGYDINDIINNLANAKTQEDFNKITKILDKLC
jgi:hypothetical protein